MLNEDRSRTNNDANNTPLSFLPIVSDMQINFCLAQQNLMVTLQTELLENKLIYNPSHCMEMKIL